MALLLECRADEVKCVIGRVQGTSADYNGETIRCQFSRGWADYKPGESAEDFIRRADEQLYLDKRTSKGEKEQVTARAFGSIRQTAL